VHPVDVTTGVLLGTAAAAGARAVWLATLGAPRPDSGRPGRAAEWSGTALVAAGCGFYIRAVWAASGAWEPVAAVAAAVLAAAAVMAAAGRTAHALRSPGRRRPRYRAPVGDGDLAALVDRHDAVREHYGALLTLDQLHRLDVDDLTRALTRAADLQTGVQGSYSARSAYAAAIGHLEAAWRPVADDARRRGLILPDDTDA